MNYSAEAIREILARHGKTLKHSLGQNFLFDKKILDAIVSSAVENNPKNIVEIGAGVGILTGILCKNADSVVTIEIDDSLLPILKDTLPHPNFRLHQGDILKVDLQKIAEEYFEGGRFVIVGNLPYYITAKILDRLEAALPLFDRAVIMVQKEVADRLRSHPGSKEYRAATVALQALFEIQYVCTVPSHCFVPAPHIDSAVLALTPRKSPLVQNEDIPDFLRFVSQIFTSRRKQIRGKAALLGTSSEKIDQTLDTLGLTSQARAEDLTPEQMVKFFYDLKK